MCFVCFEFVVVVVCCCGLACLSLLLTLLVVRVGCCLFVGVVCYCLLALLICCNVFMFRCHCYLFLGCCCCCSVLLAMIDVCWLLFVIEVEVFASVGVLFFVVVVLCLFVSCFFRGSLLRY